MESVHIWLLSSYHHSASFCTIWFTPAQPQDQGHSLWFSSCDQVSPVCCTFCFFSWNIFIFGSCLLIIILPNPLTPKVKVILLYDSFPYIKWASLSLLPAGHSCADRLHFLFCYTPQQVVGGVYWNQVVCPSVSKLNTTLTSYNYCTCIILFIFH